MKILIVNYRHYISGGPERYLFNVVELFKSKGHKVITFSVKNERNIPSEYEDYFLDPLGIGNETSAKDYRGKFWLYFKIISRYFYSFQSRKKLSALIRDTNPDIIYIIYYRALISPSIIDEAKKHKIPVIHRLSDFGKICANNVLFNYKTSEVCERCISGTKLNGIKYKCEHNSYLHSTIKVVAGYIEKIIRTNEKTDAFIITSKFSMQKFIEGGLAKDKLFYVPTFFPIQKLNSNSITYEPFAVYFGRIDFDKGVHIAIKAFNDIDLKLYIIGDSTDIEYLNRLKKLVKTTNIHFLGALDFKELSEYLKKCLFVVVPSLWYDNLPNTILESYAFSKAVVASNEGSLKYMVKDNVTGLLFKRNDPISLRLKISLLLENKQLAQTLGENAFNELLVEYNEDKHYKNLINIFESKISKNNS